MSAATAFVLRHPLGTFVVETDSAIVETQLRERLEPYVRVSAEEADRRPDLVVTARVESIPLPSGPSTEIMIRDHPHFERYRRPADLWELASEYVMLERKNSSLFRWSTDAPARVAVANADATSLAKSVRRLVQDFLRLRVWHCGGMIVEASTISLDGVGMLAVGGSGVGKTTLLARFLELGARMVSNDEVALCPGGDGIVAYGLPMLVNVRPVMVESFPRLREVADFMEAADPKAPVRYDTFAHVLGGGVESSADRLVGVLLSLGREPARDVDPSAFASALMDNILSGPGFAGMGWTSPWRMLPPGFPEPERPELERRAARIAREVPAVTIGRLYSPGDIAEVARVRLARAAPPHAKLTPPSTLLASPE
jgi:hypothetical protein